MQKTFDFTYNETTYPVVITYKRMRNIRYYFKEGSFFVNCPYLTSFKTINNGLNKFAPRLLKTVNIFELDKSKDSIYYLGKEVKINKEGGTLLFSDGKTFKYGDYDTLIELVKKQYFKVMISRTRYYESLMGIKDEYRIKFKKMKTRYGSNSSRTHTINYSEFLFMYSLEILDSLVVHELAHHFYRDHSKNFYDFIYKYYPNYKKWNKKLKKGEYY